MPDFRYPIDIGALVELIAQRGDDFQSYVGIDSGDRDDVILVKVASRTTPRWFPLSEDGAFHGAVDLGLPEVDDRSASFQGAAVSAVADGQVLQANEELVSQEGFCVGRVVIQHAAADGTPFFALYESVCALRVAEGQAVNAGDVIGAVGWHGDFPHLHFAVASQSPLGGDELAPERDESSMPKGLLVWNVRRVKVGALDAAHWGETPSGPWWVVNPIEAVRWMMGDPSLEFPGRPARVAVSVAHDTHELTLALHGPIQTVPIAFRSNAFRGSSLEGRRTDLDFEAFGVDGSGSPDEVTALQNGLVALGYNVGRTGDDLNGVDGSYGPGTTQAITHFQKRSLASFDEAAPALGSTSPSGGKVDWLTLMALDAALAAKESVPAREHEMALEKEEAPPTEPKGTFCDPPVRLISQWQAPWGTRTLHDKYTWAAAGCHPTCVAIVLRWFAEDMPRGSHQSAFDFPTKNPRDRGSQVKDTHYPQRMCEAFFPKVPPGQCGAYPIKDGTDTSVDHETLLDRAAEALGMQPKAPPGSKSPPGKVRLFQSVRVDVAAGDDARLAVIKDKLKSGPVIVLLTAPGHYVVIQGVSDDGGIFVVDPGNILCKLVGRPPLRCNERVPDAKQWPSAAPIEERLPSAYVRFDAKAQYSYSEPSPKPKPGEAPSPPKVTTTTFLARIQQIESFVFEGAPADDPDVLGDGVDHSGPIDWVFSSLVDANGSPVAGAWTLADLSGAVIANGVTGHDGLVAVPVQTAGTFSLHAEPLLPNAPIIASDAPPPTDDFSA